MKKYPFLLFLNIADVNIFLEIQKMRGYPNALLWIPIVNVNIYVIGHSPLGPFRTNVNECLRVIAKIYFFSVVITWRKSLCI